jgi:hypothetical protein
VLTAPATAQGTGPSGDNPALEQYIEQIPSSGESAKGDKRGKPLPKAVRERLRRDADPIARQLEELASNAALGAPVASDDDPSGSGSATKPSGGGNADDPKGSATNAPPPASIADGDAASSTFDPAGGAAPVPSVADTGATSGRGLADPLLLIIVLLGVTIAAVVARRATRRR